MPNLRISELPSAGPITGTELVPISQNGTTAQTTTAAISGSISLNYPFITVTQQPLLTSSRYLQVGSGLAIADGGAQNPISINVQGALASLIASGDGILTKSGSTITPRSLAISGNGLAVSNADGTGANPTISLAGFVSEVAGISSGFGLVARTTGPGAGLVSIDGTANQINVASGDTSAGNPTISIASNPIIPGTASMTIPVGTLAQQPVGADGQLRFNSDTQTFDGYASGSWQSFSLSGGVNSFSAGTTGLTPSPPSGGNIVLAGTLITSNGGTGLSSYTAGDTLYYASGTALSKLAIGAASFIVTSSGSAPQWTDPATIAVGTATNLAGGATGSVPYQSSAGTTTFLSIGTATQILKVNAGATALEYADQSTLSVGTATNIAGGAAGSIPYQTGAGATSLLAAGSGVLVGGSTPSYSTTPSLTGTNFTFIPNAALINSAVTVGTTSIALGASSLTLGGLTSVEVTQNPTTALQLATKQYVDSLAASGIHYHTPVYVEVPNTTGNLTATYNNGTAGVGATLTNAGAQAAFTADGVAVPLNARVLIYNQTNQYENGVYTLTTVGDGSTNWVLTRATDADTYAPFSPNSLGQGDAFFVTNGDTGAGETYICNTVGTITFGTTAITFAQISDSTLYTAGTGLTLTGTQFSITNTGVGAGPYAPNGPSGAAYVPSITVNAQGQITAAADSLIGIAASQVTSGTFGNSMLTNSSITVNGTSISLGASGTITAANPNALTIGAGLTGTSYDGSAAVTITLGTSGVTANTYGSGSEVPVFSVDTYGRVTSVTNTYIKALSGSNIFLANNFGGM